MNRKFVSLLLFILWIFAFFVVFFAFFLWKTGKILITWNENDYKVTLINQNNSKKSVYNCSWNCEIDNLLMVNYSLEVISDWYKPYKDVFSLNKEILEINLSLEKKMSLEQMVNEPSNISKITKVKWKKITSKALTTYENTNFIYSANLVKDKILLYNLSNGKTEELFSLRKSEKKPNFVWISWTYWVLFSSWDKKILISGNNILEFNLSSEVTFVKPINNKKYLIETDSWKFIFDKTSKKLEYFSLFDDFFYNSDGNYVALLKKSSSDLKNRFWFDDFANIIITYNPKTKEAKELYQTDLDIVNIYKKWDNIYLVSGRGNIYKLIH